MQQIRLSEVLASLIEVQFISVLASSLDGTKTRLTVTTGPTGRLSIVVGDLT